jgi:hypothetical protein
MPFVVYIDGATNNYARNMTSMKGHGVLVPKKLGQSLGERENKGETCNMSNILLTPSNIRLCMEFTQLSILFLTT